MSFNFALEIIKKFWLLIISGLPVILILSFISAMLGFIIGLACVFLRRVNKFLDWLIKIYIDLIRGTPVYVQLYFFYFGLPNLISGLIINKWLGCIFVFSFNSGAYLSEIIRSGINSIDQNQIQAGYALGLSKKNIARYIIFPQALKNISPALMNEFITLTKETSIVSIIGIQDMMYKFQAVKNQTYSAFEPLLIVFIAYYILNKILSMLGDKLERALN
jgi:polar amino acid transport system permease protein